MKHIKHTWVIDDDPLYVYFIKLLLEGIGKFENLQVYENGQEAMESMTQRVNSNEAIPELIFLDLNMPIMDGWEFLDEFSKISEEVRKNISIYIVSTSIDPRDLEKIKTLEIINGYILKPITTEDLKATITQIV